MDAPVCTPSSSSWAEGDFRASSPVGWDLIDWSETASPQVDSLSKKHDLEKNNYTETDNDQDASTMSDKDPRLAISEQSSEYLNLDFLDPTLGEVDFDTDLDFEPVFFTNIAPEQPPHQFDNSFLEPSAIVNVASFPGVLDGIFTEPNHASSGQCPLSIRPEDLVLSRNGIGEVTSGLPEAALNYSAPSVTLNDAAPGNRSSEPSSRRRPRSPSPAPATHQQRMAAGMGFFQMTVPGQPIQTPQRPRKRAKVPMSEQTRKQTADVRNKGACMRCHMQKLQCDLNTPCEKCVQGRGKERLGKVVCQRLNIRDAISFRMGNSKFGQETASVREYPLWVESATTRTITLIRPKHVSPSWPKGGTLPHLDILVKEFVPSDKDITAERWRSGQNEVILELPAFSAFDNEATTDALLGWVNDNFDHYAKDMTTQPGDYLIGATFAEALRYVEMNPDSMVKKALNIWIGARMAQEFFCVVEDNDFDIKVVDDRNSIHHGQCPVPPVLDHQLDVLMIQKMIQIQDEILADIEKVIRSRNSRTRWYEIYLTIFVMLANLQYVYKSQERWWEMHFNTGKGNAIGKAYRSISYKFMERYKFSSRNLLSHFRYGLKGPVPFTLDWNNESNKKLGDLDRDAVTFVKFVSATAIRRRDEFEENARRVKNGEYEGEMFWLSQMLIDVSLEDDDGQTP